MKKFIKQTLVAALALVMAVMIVPAVTAQAATKLTVKNFTIDYNKKVLYQVKNGTKTKLASIGKYIKSDDQGMRVSAYYDGKVYLTHSSMDDYWGFKTYVCDIKTKKISLASSSLAIGKTKGKYALCTDTFHTDVSPESLYLCKLTDSGIKKIRKITQNTLSSSFVGNDIYYSDYCYTTGSGEYKYPDTGKLVIRKTSITSSKSTKLKTIKSKQSYGFATASEFTKHSCKVYVDGKEKTVKY